MSGYDDAHYQPPAPLASLTLRTVAGDQVVANVPALIDTGADISLLPRWAIEQLGLAVQTDEAVTLEWFDGSSRSAESAELQVLFLDGRFRGRYPVVDQPHGIVGRNMLNRFRLLLDGPAQIWRRVASGE